MNARPRILYSFLLGLFLILGFSLSMRGSLRTARAVERELFVAPNGSGDCSQSNPCALQTALDQANNGDILYASQGTYTSSGPSVVSITKSIVLYGGWDGASGDSVVRDSEAYVTVLSGEGTRRVVHISAPGPVVLDGLTVANGKTISTTSAGWDGAGIYAQNTPLILRCTHIYSNVVDVYDYDAEDSYAYGGGVYVQGGTLDVHASTFRANSAWARRASHGGGLAVSGALSTTVMDTLFQDNDSWHASGLYFWGEGSDLSLLTVNDNTFADNGRRKSGGNARGGYAGAIKVLEADARIERNSFHGNSATNDYGAVYVAFSELLLAQNSITGNQNARTSGLYLYDVAPFTATNNIVAGNQTNNTWNLSPAIRIRKSSGKFYHNTVAHNDSPWGFQVDTGAVVALTNTLLSDHEIGITVTAGSTAALYSTLFYGHPEGNAEGSGSLVNIAPITGKDPNLTVDAHLGCASPAINAGVDAGITIDIDGDLRPQDEYYDIGADEFHNQCMYIPIVTKN